jgi:hypothetical protein
LWRVVLEDRAEEAVGGDVLAGLFVGAGGPVAQAVDDGVLASAGLPDSRRSAAAARAVAARPGRSVKRATRARRSWTPRSWGRARATAWR